MTRMKQYIINHDDLSEAAYPENLGFQELVEFYQKASKSEIDKMERLIKNDDWAEFKKLIYEVLGTKLK